MTHPNPLRPMPMSPLEISSLVERVRKMELLGVHQRRAAAAAAVVAGRARQANGEPYHGRPKNKKWRSP